MSRLQFKTENCVLSFNLGQNYDCPAGNPSPHVTTYDGLSRHTQIMGGQVILWLRPKVIQFIVRMSRPHQSFGVIALVATQSFCRDRNFYRDITLGRDHCPFLPSILTESRHQLLLRLQFLSRHRFLSRLSLHLS